MNPAPGVMKFSILLDFSLVIFAIYLVCLNNVNRVEKKIFKEKHQFNTVYPQITTLG